MLIVPCGRHSQFLGSHGQSRHARDSFSFLLQVRCSLVLLIRGNQLSLGVILYPAIGIAGVKKGVAEAGL